LSPTSYDEYLDHYLSKIANYQWIILLRVPHCQGIPRLWVL